jgi:hypothetical protein
MAAFAGGKFFDGFSHSTRKMALKLHANPMKKVWVPAKILVELVVE